VYNHFGHFTLKLNLNNNNIPADGKVSLELHSMSSNKNLRAKNLSAVYIVKNAAAHVLHWV